MTTDNNNKGCLFPSTNDGNHKALFPSVSSSATTATIATTILPQCKSFQQDVNLVDNDDKIVIDLSSNDSDSSIEFIGKRRRRKHSKKKSKHKHRHRKDEEKKKKKSESMNDNSYLSYLPKGSNFIEDIPNLRSEDAYRLDRNGDRNNLAFNKLYERYVPKYQSKHVIHLCRDKLDEEKKRKKIQRYFQRKKKIKSNNTDGNFIYPKDNLFNETNIDYIRLIDIDDLSETTITMTEQPTIQFESFKDLEQIRQQQQQGPRMAPSIQQSLMEMTRIFNHNLYEDRTNVDQWIDFIHFQDLAHFHGVHSFQDPSMKANVNEMENDNKMDSVHKKRKLCVERKFDICTKALEHNRRSIKLNLLRLKLLSQYSDELQKDCRQ
ncbi:UPF0614 protein C14orf102-like protein, partial [Euroglyphus maynei]